jgi:hypothetical protein
VKAEPKPKGPKVKKEPKVKIEPKPKRARPISFESPAKRVTQGAYAIRSRGLEGVQEDAGIEAEGDNEVGHDEVISAGEDFDSELPDLFAYFNGFRETQGTRLINELIRLTMLHYRKLAPYLLCPFLALLRVTASRYCRGRRSSAFSPVRERPSCRRRVSSSSAAAVRLTSPPCCASR